MSAPNLPALRPDGAAMSPWTEADFQVDAPTAERIERAISENTKIGYAHDRKAFHTWCAEANRCPLPATPQTLAVYATYLADSGRAPRSIERAISAIRTEHRVSGWPEPATDAALAAIKTHRRDRAEQGIRDRQASAVLLPHLREMVDSTPDTIAGVRDRALIVLGWAMMARRSELVGLNLSDLDEDEDGLLVLIRVSKTDQQGVGEVVHVPYGSHPETCPVRLVRALRAVLAERGITDGPLFRSIDRHGHLAGELSFAGRAKTARLSGDGVARILTRAARAAGITEQVSPHGLRSGGATGAYRAGGDPLKIARHGRWKDGSPVLYRYIRTVDKWKDNPMRNVGL